MPKRHRPGTSAASILRHVEEIVLATSGEDAFELVYAVAAARLGAKKLEVRPVADRALFARVDRLLAGALEDEGTLDAIFESLVPRVAKADKGQFFTPRPVVELVTRLLAPKAGELVVDPACGSGAFLSHARRRGAAVRGADVDLRAVRVARLLAIAAGGDAKAIERTDGLHAKLGAADVVATNPPFAGRADAKGFSIAAVVRTPERDALFLERALELLKPGGRLGIVLPYNKASGAAFAGLRQWLVARARVLAVVGLARETFLPHTSQRTFVLLAQKRDGQPSSKERTFFGINERAGKDTGGEPILGDDGEPDDDLDELADELEPFLRAEGFA